MGCVYIYRRFCPKNVPSGSCGCDSSLTALNEFCPELFMLLPSALPRNGKGRNKLTSRPSGRQKPVVCKTFCALLYHIEANRQSCKGKEAANSTQLFSAMQSIIGVEYPTPQTELPPRQVPRWHGQCGKNCLGLSNLGNFTIFMSKKQSCH